MEDDFRSDDPALLNEPFFGDLDINDAVRNDRVARVPLIVKAVDIYEGLISDLVLPEREAQKIRSSSTASLAMNKAGVMIVISM